MSGVIERTRRAGRWAAAPDRTTAGFAVRGLGGGLVHGTLPVREAWVQVDDAGRPVGAHAVVDMTGVATGNARRDKDLRGAKLLGVERFPAMTFSGGPPEATTTGWTMPGQLAVRDRTLPVLLDVVVTAESDGGITVTATSELDRLDAGVRAPRMLVGRRVRLQIQATLTAPEG